MSDVTYEKYDFHAFYYQKIMHNRDFMPIKLIIISYTYSMHTLHAAC